MKFWKSTLAYSSLVAMLVGGAPPAAADQALQEMFKGWAQESSRLVSSKMKFPVIGIRGGNTNAIQLFYVTVDADGTIKDFDLVTRKGQKRFIRSSERALTRLASFPALPDGYYSRELTFVLVMDYDASARMTRSMWTSYNSTRTGIYDITGDPSSGDVVMLGARITSD